MNKTIIAIYGKRNQGKSETIKNICNIFLTGYLNAVPTSLPNYAGEISLTIQLSTTKIGIQSTSNTKILQRMTCNKSHLNPCDIIIYACKTKKEHIRTVKAIAADNGYHILWISSYFSRKLNNTVLNNKAAENIVDLIKSIIIEEL